MGRRRAGIADDPAQLATLRAKTSAWWAQREADDAALDAIARASGLHTP
ncbi:hypothetical protein ACIBCM_06440 [Streptomyces sp. NPDC051018]